MLSKRVQNSQELIQIIEIKDGIIDSLIDKFKKNIPKRLNLIMLANKMKQESYHSKDLTKTQGQWSGLSLQKDNNQPDVIKNRKNFTVAVRVKPQFSTTPSSLINLSVKKLSEKSEELTLNFEGRRYQYNSYGQNSEKKFVFDKVYETESQNSEIFNSLIDTKLGLLQKGVNLAIMAYGATNSGKTYTIFGKKQDQIGKYPVQGLSSMTFKKVFQLYRNEYTIAFSFVQIYNQNVYDLLNPQTITNPLNVMEDSQGNTNVIGLNKIQIFSPSQLEKLITSGNQARISCSNLQNIHSSRSHAFMELELKHKTTRQKTKMVIVDLAGSQKYLYSASSNNLLKEGSNINKSLLSLGNCIKSLYQNQQHIPYRDSKLTRLLKENLSGYAHNIMIACINKKINNFEENLNSLNYALKAMKIEKEIVRKVQSQELSEYQCTMCREKLPYALIKEINKHEEHRKRVKTRESQSLSVSPIAKNSSQILAPFKSQSKSSAMKSTYKKCQKLIDEAFESILLKALNSSMSPQDLVQIVECEKKSLQMQMRDYIFSSKGKNLNRLETQTNQQAIKVSEFDSPSQQVHPESQLVLKQNENIPERKLKISLSKPKKQHLEKTASTNNNSQLSNNDNGSESNKTKRYNSSKNYIKIEDESEDSSVINSFRSNLTVDILNDRERILDQRKRALEEATYNQRKKSVQSTNILKFKSTQNNLRNKNIENFISCTQSNPQNKIKFKPTNNDNNFMMKMHSHEDNQSTVRPFEDFMINQRMLDSTSIAPRMKRDEQEMGAWKNIVIKNVESPAFMSQETSQIEESFVQERVRPTDERRDRLFKAIRS